jgi:hypothetical protein
MLRWVIVRCTGELGAVLGETPNVVVQTFSRLLLAVAQFPLLAGSGVRALEVANKSLAQLCPVVDPAMGKVLEPRPRGVAKVER